MKKFILSMACLGLSLTAYAQNEKDSVKLDQYGIKVDRKPLITEERNGILVMESKDSEYKIWFDIRVHVDAATFWGQDKDYDPIGDGGSIRRARFAVKGQVTPKWYGEVDVNFANGVVELKDAIVRYTGFSDWELQAGNFKENFQLSRNTSSRYQPLMERPMMANTLGPSRSMGVNAKYQKKWLFASYGLFFHAVEDAETRTYVEDNNKDYGRKEGLAHTAKVVFQPLYKNSDASLHIGTAVSRREPSTDVDPGEYGGVRISSRNATSINRKKYLDTDVIPNVDYSLFSTYELAGHYKAFRFETAYVQDNVYILDSAPSTQDKSTKIFRGAYVMASYVLFGGKHNYDYGGAKFNQITRGRSWGDIEIAARYDYMNLNSGGIYGGSGENYTFGVNYYASKNVRFSLNYQYSNNDRYANGKGKLYVGHDVYGNPTKDPSQVTESNGKAGVDYNMLSARIQIDF